jgi:hypothetical protein
MTAEQGSKHWKVTCARAVCRQKGGARENSQLSPVSLLSHKPSCRGVIVPLAILPEVLQGLTRLTLTS